MAKEHEQHASKASEEAMRENDAHTRKVNNHDAVPGDDTAHAHSHAAHLDETHGKTKIEPGQAGGSKIEELREPTMDRTRRHDEPQRRNG